MINCPDQLSSVQKNPGWLFDIGDFLLPSFFWDYNTVNRYNDPKKTNQDFMECQQGFVAVAQFTLFTWELQQIYFTGTIINNWMGYLEDHPS